MFMSPLYGYTLVCPSLFVFAEFGHSASVIFSFWAGNKSALPRATTAPRF
jgi:hypothetical protein